MWENISDAFRASTAFMTFLTIFGVGLGITLLSLVFGGDHDHGDMGHADGHDGDDGNQGPGLFSIRGLSLFATGFGGIGLLVMQMTNQVLTASISGAAFGFVFAFLGITVMRALIRQQASTMIQPASFNQIVGEVSTTIPEHGVGEVRLTVEGTTMTKTASSVSGRRIPTGSLVRVVRAAGGTVAVEEVSPQESAR